MVKIFTDIYFTMKQLLIFYSFILLLSCQQNRSSNQKETAFINADTLNVNKDIAKIVLVDGEKMDIPEGILLDSSFTFDSKRRINFHVTTPKFKNKLNVACDRKIDSIIENRRIEFMKYIKGRLKEYPQLTGTAFASEFRVEPVSIYKDTKMVSYCFTIDWYEAGAIHPMHEYYSFNYDLNKGKQVNFVDYFILNDNLDSNYIIENINKSIGQTDVPVTKIYEMDFNIEIDTISFNFDAYERGSYGLGMPRARFGKVDWQNHITADYR